MEKAISTPEEIVNILTKKGYSAKVRENDKNDKTVILKDKDNGGNHFFSGEGLKELIKFINELKSR